MIDEQGKKPHEQQIKKKKKSALRWLWKAPLIIVSTLVGLLLLIMGLSSLILTPERLTRWVNEYGTDYLVDGRVDAGRVELTIWSTFPHIELKVENLQVLNLNEEIPQEYRKVVSVEGFSGRLNVMSLIGGKIDLNNVELVRPEATLWFGTDSINSLSILPPSEDDDEDETSEFPDLKLSDFNIVGDGCVRYISPADNIDARIVLHRSELRGSGDDPQYTLSFDGNLGGLGGISKELEMGIYGSIGWDPANPLQIDLGDFRVTLGMLEALFSTSVDLTENLIIKSLDLEIKPVGLQYLSELLAESPDFKDIVPRIEGNAAVSFKARLDRPYDLSDTVFTLPDLYMELNVGDGTMALPDYFIHLDNLGLDLTADLSPAGPDSTMVNVRRLNVRFPASDFTLNAEATNLGSDPAVSGCLRGRVNFTNMNPNIWPMLGMRLLGRMDADFDFDLNMSDLTANTFHRAMLGGEATLRDFEALLPSDSLAAGATRAEFTFGSSRKFIRADFRADSLLTASLNVDSAWVIMPELTAQLSELKMGVGIENRAASTDTTTVTPMGGRLSLKSLRYQSAADSSRAALRELSGALVLKRYQGEDRAPQLGADLKVKRIFYSDGTDRVSLRGAEIYAGGHLNQTQRKRRAMSHADSVRFAARRDSMLAARSRYESIDFNIDRSTVSLLRRWNISGGVKAERGRLVTPLFPIRTSMRNLDFSFNADSLKLNSLNVGAGQSDFSLRGNISNIQRALGRRAGSPLKIDLELMSDTLNVNEILQTLFRGAAYEESASGNLMANLESEDELIEAEADSLASDITMAPVIPMNIDAKFFFKARNMLYSTLQLRDFEGEVLVSNGAANLRDLHAEADIGTLDLNLLYCAPTRSDVNFGMSLDLNRFNIGKVTEVVPSLDSIMPILNTLAGVVDVNISVTTPADSLLNVMMPEMKAMVSLSGDSLRLIDPQTFKTVSKWLFFRDKNKNMIDHMDVRLAVENNLLQLYPFMFDFDRYRLGVMGHNDLDMNLDYHVSVLKSPLPFRFGINIKGTTDKMKIRLGRARFKEEMAAHSEALSDTVRMNLANEIRSVFARGAKAARLGPLKFKRPDELPPVNEQADTISASDSLYLRQEGLIELPDSVRQE